MPACLIFDNIPSLSPQVSSERPVSLEHYLFVLQTFFFSLKKVGRWEQYLSGTTGGLTGPNNPFPLFSCNFSQCENLNLEVHKFIECL